MKGENLKGENKDEVSNKVRRMFLETSMKQPRKGNAGGRLDWSQTGDCVITALLGFILELIMFAAIAQACFIWGAANVFYSFIIASILNAIYVVIAM